MPIAPGTRLGPYEVVSLIGAGGMGEVYRARDARLQREVAIKVLPEGVARDPEQRARFEREAQAVAALSHPNVLAIFDTGSHGDHLFAVTELLNGQTLRDRVRTGPLPIAKAIDWAVQIARGLAAAHDKQLVHRDLKPENIFVTADGHVKILDFGLAKASVAGKAESETAPAVTGEGTVLGTVGYMAPEQVRGLAATASADLFAFGAVLHEMLTGERAFRRETPAETLTAILREEPAPLAEARPEVPPALERIVRHCLEKDPHERFQSARDVAFALEALSAPASTSAASAARVASGPHAPAGSRLPWARIGIGAAVVAVLIAAGFWIASQGGFGSRPDAASDESLALGAATQVTTDDGLEINPALSPDGRLLAYASGHPTGMRIFIRPLAGGRILTLSEGSSAFEYQPRWSPDGTQILFIGSDGAFVASAIGGTTRRIAAGAVSSVAWAPDGKRVLIGRGRSLSIVPLDGGAEGEIATGSELHSCDWSARGDWIACASGNSGAVVPGLSYGNVAPSGIVAVPAAGGPLVTVAERKWFNVSPVFSADGLQLYFVSNRAGPADIYVVPFRGAATASETPQRVTTGLGLQSMSFGDSGRRLVYDTYRAQANLWSLPIPPTGTVDTSGATALTKGSQVIELMRASPDGKWLIYDSTLHLNAEIFRIPVEGGTPQRLTNEPADDFAPDLSPDGREMAFHSWRSGSRDVYVQLVDGGPARAVTATPRQESYPIWSPDGTRLAFVENLGIFKSMLYVVRRDAAGDWGSPVLLLEGTGHQGVWMSDTTLAFPTDRGIEVVSTQPGPPTLVYPLDPKGPKPFSVLASDDRRTLYFKSLGSDGRSSIWAVPVSGGQPRRLVNFTDPARPSIRPDFGVGAGRLFFTLEDRQADIWVAEVTRR